jgi:hypothetical protein
MIQTPYPLIAGPYRPPKVRLGQVVHDEHLGDVRVDGRTDAPIRWPATFNQGRLTPILFGSLVCAITTESEMAVAHHWGVSKYQIDQWKRTLVGGGSCGEVIAKLALLRYDRKFRKKHCG